MQEQTYYQEIGRRGGQTTGARNRAKLVCPHGHPYSGDNLYVNPTTGGAQVPDVPGGEATAGEGEEEGKMAYVILATVHVEGDLLPALRVRRRLLQALGEIMVREAREPGGTTVQYTVGRPVKKLEKGGGA